MPVHDWTKVDAGIFHAFAFGWVCDLSGHLNRALNPKTHYALISPSLYDPADFDYMYPGSDPEIAYIRRQKRVTIHAVPGDKVVAVIDLLEAPLKRQAAWLRTYVLRTRAAIARGVHHLILDLHAPTRVAPFGVHRYIWSAFHTPVNSPDDARLGVLSYSAGPTPAACLEPVAVGDALPDMPLFLTPDAHIPVPLEASYAEAWSKIPSPWREVLDPPPA